MILDQADLLAGRYRLLDRIGSGGMGVVWSADDCLLRRRVAIKEVHPDHEGRMRHEAQVGAKVSHPNVVTVYDLVYEDGKPWLVMRLVPSRSLAAVLADDGPMRPGQAAAMGRQVLAGLMAVHAQGVVHCDVKPGNVLLDERDDAHLTDFGIAADTGSRMVGTLFGAPSYIAPERARGLPMGPASDLWSLGATLYAAVEGHPPLDRGDPLATVTAIVTERPEPPAHAAGLRPVIDGLLSPDPADRPDVGELDRMLRRVADGTSSITISRPLPRHLSPAPPLRSAELSMPRHRAVGTATGFTPPPADEPDDPDPAAEPPKGDLNTEIAEPDPVASVRVPAQRHATTAIHLPRPPLLHRTPLVMLGLTAGIAAGLLWFGGHTPAPIQPSSPAAESSEAPAANPEAVAVQPSAKPAAAPAAQAPAQPPARAPEAFSGQTSGQTSAEPPSEPPVTTTEAPEPTTTTVAPTTTTDVPTTTAESTQAEASTPPPNGA